MTDTRALALVAFLLLAGAMPAAAGDTQAEVVPEVNAFIKLSEDTRLFFLGSLTVGLSDSTTSGETGAYLDITLKPILRERLRGADWERDRYLWIRLGYAVLGSLDEGERVVTEYRGVFEVTGRASLPAEVWLVNRVRGELRELDGDFSTRFRYRLGIEREFLVGGISLVPYAQAEVFYDSRFGAWNRQLYQAGVEIEITKHWRVEPYYARQEDQHSSPPHLNQFGLVVKLYW